MLNIKIKLTRTFRCPKRHHYNPATDLDGVKGGCPHCMAMRHMYLKVMELGRVIREYEEELWPAQVQAKVKGKAGVANEKRTGD